MNFFSLLVASVLTLTHLYLFWTLRRFFGGGVWQYVFALCYLSAMAVHFCRFRAAALPWIIPVADAFNYYLGLVLIVTVCFLAGDVLRIVLWLVDSLAGTRLGYWLAPARSGRFFAAAGLLCYAYGIYEARSPRVKIITLKTDLLPPGRDKVRLVALADIHLSSHIDAERLAAMVDLANRQNADIAVLLGDTVDSDMRQKRREVEVLQRFEGPSGRFAVLGNHEAYAGLSQAVRFHEEAGFRLLRGDAVEAGGITLVGVDDPRTRGQADSAEALGGVRQDEFVVLLSHRPTVPDGALGRFDIQLSGHTHGGQVFPGRLFSRWVNGYWQGLTALPGGRNGDKASALYISNGVGLWGPPVRFLTPPEVTVVDIVRADAAADT